ncbi:MAG: efflux RND transporter permease subunit, partial [Candidatus Geothermincolia bacterium]
MKVFESVGRASEKRPWAVLIGIVAVTVVMVLGMTRITSNFDFKVMLPDEAPSVRALDTIDSEFGGTFEERVLLEAEDVLRPELLRAMASYGDELAQSALWQTFAERATTPLDDMQFFTPAALQALAAGDLQSLAMLQRSQMLPFDPGVLSDEQLLEQVNANLAYGQLAQQAGMMVAAPSISGDRRAALVVVTVTSDLASKDQGPRAKEFISFSNSHFAGLDGINVYVGGDITGQVEALEESQSETMLLFGIAFLFILLVLFLTFRRISDVLLTVMVILVTIIWVQGMSGWLNIPFTFTSAGIMPLLLGIDIAYAIHVLSRYYEERRKGEDALASVFTSVKTVGVAVFLTAATTAFGFASFGISNMPPIQQFGVLCVLGVLFAFVLAVTLLPATIALRDRSPRAQTKWAARHARSQERKNGNGVVDTILVKIALLAEHHRVTVVTGTLLILATSIFLATQVTTEMDFKDMMASDTPTALATEKVADYFGGQEQALTVVSGDIFSPQAMQAMLAFEDGIVANSPTDENGLVMFDREKITSIADIVAQQFGGIPQDPLQLKAISPGFVGNPELAGLISADGDTALIVARLTLTTDTDTKKAAGVMDSEALRATNGA